jgi:hypothetical protein
MGKKKKNEDLVLGEQAVLDMHEDCTGKNHHPYFSNCFSSTELMKMLFDMSWEKELFKRIQEP